MNMQQSEPDHEAWGPCPPGTLSRVIRTVRARRRANLVGRVVASAAMVLAVVVGWTMLSGRLSAPQEFEFGGIRCSEVRQVAGNYLSGDLKEEDPEFAEKVAEHVSRCPHCSKLIDRMREETGTPVAFLHRRSDCTGCSDPSCPHRHPDDANRLLFLAQVDDAHWASR